eukprot:TRINITY_DN1500_c0_g1_i14.p1 TRINITY_DN1500_c0_g1~~TRINITY_DN1500_c0_g1_i14.p1  ORF type:complete len:126 (-),score=26.81 TRINITY_DN1500_c0_g1_i14:210-587(-)
MSWLTSLNISGNSFTELPEGITKLAKLENLVIADEKGNMLTYRCFAAMSSSLKALLKLSGENALIALKSMAELQLARDGLPSVPESIGLLTNLMVLDLRDNYLSSLPESIESIGQLTNLTKLWLH